MTLRVGVIGCGLIGTRRARVAASAGDRVVAVADSLAERADTLAAEVGASARYDWQAVVTDPAVDAVVVATVNASLAEIAVAALDAGKHVLCEKPFGRNADEAAMLLAAANGSERVVKAGFTLRHHDAVARAREIAWSGEIGEPVGLRAAYGHGGRPGFEHEWRADPALSGGGELLDQGVHLVDLSRWFLGDFAQVTGLVSTWAWPIAPVEDNAFALLTTLNGRAASLHTSWTQWRNLFRLEVLGSDGLVLVEGLGGSYGPERLVEIRRRPEGGRPDERELTVRQPARAWRSEWDEFTAAILEGREPLGSARDGYEAARLVDAIYASAQGGGVIRLEAVPVA